MRHYLLAGLSLSLLSACATTQVPVKTPVPPSYPPVSQPPVTEPVYTPPAEPHIPDPQPVPLPPVYEPSPPPPPPQEPPAVEVPPVVSTPSSAFASLPYWYSADHSAGLEAFQRSCKLFIKADPNKSVNANLPEYGSYSDWHSACQIAQATPSSNARAFFESEFLPVKLHGLNHERALLTGYYQPEITVSTTYSSTYSEPILAVPTNDAVKSLPRSQINAGSSRVIAYGRPIDVFFMQIQGSGVIAFPDGRKMRAAYGANNGFKYTSIGRVLVERGELQKDKASKQSIEQWMQTNGSAATREIMNQNKRYIFFREEALLPGEGPKGAMRVPLTAMGSIAVDERYHPYGVPIWLETNIPLAKGDYKGSPTGLLVVTQDTGKAIRGAMRGDLYFGSGTSAGDRAGVMKHPAEWTVLLPYMLALKIGSFS